MANQDEILPQTKRKLANVMIPGAISSTCSDESILEDGPEKTYIFPGLNPNDNYRNTGFTTTIDSPVGSNRGHARSVSHGGGVIGHSLQQQNINSRPLKSALRGHQRALSQGQIPEVGVVAATPPSRSGHTRGGSKTDFILPPDYKDTFNERVPVNRDITHSSSVRGHSRQASRSESIYTLRRNELPPWWKRYIYCRTSKLEERGYRIVVPNHTVPSRTPKHEHPNGHRVGNKIRTTKYTLLSFIPKNLLEQFHRVANLYFIFIVLLNWFPQINAFGKEIAMIPVLFVLGVTAIKDLFEDRRRRASDKRINNSTCRVYNGEFERYKKVLWQDVRVGDLIHLSNNETVPADILLLRTSASHGVCYIDTCDLDGETNLKRREVVKGFVEKQNLFTPSKFKSRVEVDTPSTKIYRFHGAVIHSTGERIPVASENLLLRESRLKNTDFIEGLVVYAGHETKSMLNNSGPRYKRSQIEQQMNIDVIWCVLILIILCLIGAIGYKMWLTPYVNKNAPFLPEVIDPAYEGLLNFWTFVIILQIMIPLSLYVTIELSKILQVYHIHNNIELYDSQTNKQTECRAMNITEELGQVQYVFSDKTGTLTENKMIFRRCSIAGVDYNHLPSELETQYSIPGSPPPPLVLNQKLLDDMNAKEDGGHNYTSHAQKIHEFLLVLAICNTVVVSQTPHHDLMNASGMIESQDDSRLLIVSNHTDDNIRNGPLNPTNKMHDRYARLAESRSVTPSPPPNSLIPPNSLVVKSQHIPSLSPISSSAETTPTSESPQLNIKSITSSSVSPTKRTKKIISSKLNSISSILSNTMNHSKKNVNLSTSKVQGSSTYATNGSDRPIYEAESPDELALVNAAYSYDCGVLNRSPSFIIVNQLQEGIQEFEILKVFPFDSNRKCMSIVVRRTETQDVILYTKGADSSIMSALSDCNPNSVEGHFRERTQQQLDSYARQGLRVLVVGKRILSHTEFNDWLQKHQENEMSHEFRERKIRESFSTLEQNLTLLGATGIEDRLQEGVPETISSLLSAGIVVWVVTGDKPETAINVAYSAKLFTPNMELLKLTARSRDSAECNIMFYLNEIEKQLTSHKSFETSRRNTIKGLVVDGKTLTFILDLRSNLTKPFLRLTKYCSAVLCCRSTPLQKAFLVKIVKDELQMSTLAIGDGANDVSMIQMADVGVGISGQEGMQAVMASDFTLAKFKMLERLLLVHGHWCYDRLARMIIFFFYKNASFVFLIFWYQLYCGFSGTVMIDQMYLMLFNFVFTSLPPIAIGVYDKNIPEDLLMKRPYLYKHGRRGQSYKSYTFWVVMLDSLYQSFVIFFVAKTAYWDTDVGLWEFGTTIGTSCLATMLLHCAIEIQSWTILHLLSIVISLGSFYAYSLVYNAMCVNCLGLPSTYWVIYVCIGSIKYWLVIFLTVVIAVLPRFFIRILQTSIWPSDSVKAILAERKLQNSGEDLLVSWSRSTSASSIYRVIDQSSKNQNIATIAT